MTLIFAVARPYIVAIYTNDVHIMPIAMYLLWFAIVSIGGWLAGQCGRLSAWHAGYTGSDVDYPDGVLGEWLFQWFCIPFATVIPVGA